ncbi:hypothetical protein [Aerosakkonema funiforme]|nr:hypothetical protein [Aerosakkonema funiforme]
MKYICLLLLLMLCFAVALPAEASFCRQTNDRLICVLRIDRSAKNHWEYRAIVSVDGVERPMQLYNCRDRITVRKDGTVVPFEPNGPGKLICSVLHK